jgi:cysteine desulfurase/selenocysteine lyase
VRDFYENHNGNVHRAVHTLSLEATELYEKSRERITEFINAKHSSEIIFVRGTTEAINLVAYSWGLDNLSKGAEVLVSLMEHHSNIIPWETIAKLKGFKIKYAQVTSDGTLDYDDFESKLCNKTKMVCLSHVSNVTGVINDIKHISKVVHDNGAILLVDGAQSVPHMPVDLQDLDIDFLAFSGHKMLGPTGIGVLYGKAELLKKMRPFQGGGEMIKEVVFSQDKNECRISWNELPWKFEAGTPNIAGAIGLGVAINYLENLGMSDIFDHEKSLTAHASERMKETGKIQIYGPSDLTKKLGIIPFGVKGLSSHDVALFFDNYGIMIRSGYHCAQPLHQEALNLQSSARASFYVYNTKEEINRFIEILQEFEQL